VLALQWIGKHLSAIYIIYHKCIYSLARGIP
jgi:hypothetical protein